MLASRAITNGRSVITRRPQSAAANALRALANSAAVAKRSRQSVLRHLERICFNTGGRLSEIAPVGVPATDGVLAPAACGTESAPLTRLAAVEHGKQGAQSEHVCVGTDRTKAPVDLLWRHEANCAHDRRIVRIEFRLEPGKTEIRDEHPARPIDKHVGRLKVAMNHSVLVGVADGVGHIRHDVGRALDRQRLAAA